MMTDERSLKHVAIAVGDDRMDNAAHDMMTDERSLKRIVWV